MFKTIYEKVIVGVLTAICLAVLIWLWDAVRDLRIGLGTPQNAVVAFDDPSGCPAGWSDMGEKWRGHVVVAASNDANDIFAFGRAGGTETIVINATNLPEHQHSFSVSTTTKHAHYDGGSKFEAISADHPDHERIVSTSPIGSGVPIGNMQPYVSLYLCKRS